MGSRGRLALVAGPVAALALLGACSSTTTGTGRMDGSSPSGSTSADFPSGTTAPPTDSSAPTSPSGPTSTTPAVPIHSAPAQPLRIATAQGYDGRTYEIRVWAEVKDATCSDHAWGQPMINFLVRHPCDGLHRVLATTELNGRQVGIAQSSTSFPGTARDPYRYAAEFRRLELADNTGSINDLMREGYRLPSGPTIVPASEAFTVLGQDNAVSVFDLWYLEGTTPNQAKPLMRLAEQIFLQF